MTPESTSPVEPYHARALSDRRPGAGGARIASPRARRCGAWVTADGVGHFAVWAPRAEAVELVLIDGGGRRRRTMARGERGAFTWDEAGVQEGQTYAFRLDGGPERPDPCSLSQPQGVHGPSAVVRPERFVWTD